MRCVRCVRCVRCARCCVWRDDIAVTCGVREYYDVPPGMTRMLLDMARCVACFAIPEMMCSYAFTE
eukprot:3176696-Lingulodinium_polyedra.AAC.1